MGVYSGQGGGWYGNIAGSRAGTGGNGDVVGPASSTDNALVVWDGTTGKLVKNGIVTQTADGRLTNATPAIGPTDLVTLNQLSGADNIFSAKVPLASPEITLVTILDSGVSLKWDGTLKNYPFLSMTGGASVDWLYQFWAQWNRDGGASYPIIHNNNAGPLPTGSELPFNSDGSAGGPFITQAGDEVTGRVFFAKEDPAATYYALTFTLQYVNWNAEDFIMCFGKYDAVA